jgi:hypothetical protein
MELENKGDLETEIIESLQPIDECIVKNSNNRPKHGSKRSIIEKILKVCEDTDEICEYSTTKLHRMPKKDLLNILADKIELGVQKKITEQAGMQNISNDMNDVQRQRLVAMGFLSMGHKILTKGTETMLESYSDYSITGFTENFDEPRTKEMLEQTLLEIAEEMEVLDYIDSPWSKLALLWGNGIVRTLKRKPINYTNHNVTDLEPDQY